jgi:exosortase C (VPDSG-CTERM-specific)
MGFVGYVLLVSLLFSKQLFHLFVSAYASDLNSYIILIPLAVAYLLYLERQRLPHIYCPAVLPAVVTSLLGLGIVAFVLVKKSFVSGLSQNDQHFLWTLSFVCLIWAGGFVFLGRQWMRTAAFPLGFLLFLVPLPDAIVQWLEDGLKLASSEAASLFFAMSGTPFVRTGTVFQLPGFTIRVAQECSGIKSSWVLFITSLLAGYLFLAKPWRRILLAGAVIPLGILRNGFRIMVIGLLCVHVSPQMIDSPLHRRGGPIFFVLSLLPLWLLLWFLRRRDHAAPENR